MKFDIEGSENEAIEGMIESIERFKPMLGISVYHVAGDIHKLINKILMINPRYSVYLRHYTDSYADTMAYFIDDNVM